MGAVAAIGGALVRASAAKKAAKAQTSAANKDIAFQKETRDLIRSDLGVYREGGDLAQRALDFELGLGARPDIWRDCAADRNLFDSRNAAECLGQRGSNGLSAKTVTGSPTTGIGLTGQTFTTMAEAQAYADANRTGGTEYGGYTKTPGYDFRLPATGQPSVRGGGAGGLYSGAAMRDLDEVWAGLRIERIRNYLSCPGAGRYWHGRGADERAGFAAGSGGRVERSGNIGNAKPPGPSDRRTHGLAGRRTSRACGTTRRTWGGRPGPTATAALQRTVWRQWAGRL